ncbi:MULTISPECIES: AAA family ATPase [unclassified Nocardia]|uniref:AAA family ATPase n=1 Tax=unclassified Nocardia TaxID=2637762 RepID=UPI001CE3BFC4|nr:MULTISPECIES: AAA family ATPase [unclassified Nocardia]
MGGRYAFADSDGRFIREIRLDPDAVEPGYPFNLPAVRFLARSNGLTLPGGVTFLVGENGSGKSTLLEAIAVAAGINAEGGSQSFNFATRASESCLGKLLTVAWGIRKPRSRFFLRAESYYNVTTELERLDAEPGSPPLLPAYGGVLAHERSHGESFIDLMRHRFRPNGLYLLDEPEAALSPRGCVTVLARLTELVAQGCQVVAATHSPILLALPGARIYEIDDSGEISVVDYDAALPVRLTRQFLAAPDQYLRHLLDADN